MSLNLATTCNAFHSGRSCVHQLWSCVISWKSTLYMTYKIYMQVFYSIRYFFTYGKKLNYSVIKAIWRHLRSTLCINYNWTLVNEKLIIIRVIIIVVARPSIIGYSTILSLKETYIMCSEHSWRVPLGSVVLKRKFHNRSYSHIETTYGKILLTQ